MTTQLDKVPTPDHLDLESLITRLRAEPDHVVAVGFHNPHSYRGYYTDLAFEVCGPTTIDHLLAVAEGALGVTFTGWKGGDYTMRDYTSVWLVREEGECGESLGAVLLELLLANVSGHTAHITGTVHGTVVQAGNIDGGLRL